MNHARQVYAYVVTALREKVSYHVVNISMWRGFFPLSRGHPRVLGGRKCVPAHIGGSLLIQRTGFPFSLSREILRLLERRERADSSPLLIMPLLQQRKGRNDRVEGRKCVINIIEECWPGWLYAPSWKLKLLSSFYRNMPMDRYILNAHLSSTDFETYSW